MGILDGLFNRMGNWHIRMLTKECVKLILDTLGNLKYQYGNDVYIDSALDLLIEEGGYNIYYEQKRDITKDIFEDKHKRSNKESKEKIIDLSVKFREFVFSYVVRQLWTKYGRELDFVSGEDSVLYEEIEKYWDRIKDSKTIVNIKV